MGLLGIGPHVAEVALLGAQSVDLVVGLAALAHKAAQAQAVGGRQQQALGVDVAHAEADGRVVLGRDEAAGGGALLGQVQVHQLLFLVLHRKPPTSLLLGLVTTTTTSTTTTTTTTTNSTNSTSTMSLRNRTREFHAIATQSTSTTLNTTTLNTTAQQAKECSQMLTQVTQDIQHLAHTLRMPMHDPQQTTRLQASITHQLQLVGHRVSLLNDPGGVAHLLQQRVQNTSLGFRDMLEQNMHSMQQRSARRLEYAQPTSSLLSPPGHQLLQQHVIDLDVSQDRQNAISGIESTIHELGQIYQQFASVLSSQREMVQRIDDNVEMASVNVDNAHAQLIKYYQGIQNNPRLIAQVFGVLMVFFLLFVLVT